MAKIEDLDFSRDIKKGEVLKILKKEVSEIHIADIMRASAFLIADAKYVHPDYREEYIKSYTKAFFTRIKEIKDDKNKYKGKIKAYELQESLKLLRDQEDSLKLENKSEACFFKIYKIMSIYTTYVLNEPVHLVGTSFPGGFKVRYEDGVYLCPVKEAGRQVVIHLNPCGILRSLVCRLQEQFEVISQPGI